MQSKLHIQLPLIVNPAPVSDVHRQLVSVRTQVLVHKPAGLQVLPTGPFIQRTALTLLQRAPRLWPILAEAPISVHRLGRGTSGENHVNLLSCVMRYTKL